MNEDIVTNFYLPQNHTKEGINKLSKVEKIKKKRLDRKLLKKSAFLENENKQDELDGNKNSLLTHEGEEQIVVKKKHKRHKVGEDDAKSQHKFSSLFKNNPDIPQVEKLDVKPLKEEVFSKERFSELNLHPHLVSCLETHLGITRLTAVQEKSIPHVLQGRDVMVKSQTGSGKTLCYAVPVVQDLQSIEPPIHRHDGPYAIVILPTRELALQSYETFQVLVKSFVRLVPGCIMGGEKKAKEKARLRKGVNIVLGTPGRLLDHLHNTRALDIDRVKYLILDEADRMLDMGYEKEVSQIVTMLKERSQTHRQTVLLSATLTAKVEQLAGISLQHPVKIDFSENAISPTKHKDGMMQHQSGTDTAEDGTFVTPENLKHHYVIVPNKLRLVTLAAFLLWKAKYSKGHKKVVVFFTTQFSVEFHHKILGHILSDPEEDDLDLYSLHGDMSQQDRTAVFLKFSQAETGILLCTDVAARGLNLQNVRWIVQYNTPGKATDYIHRVGRTARIGGQGHALLFLTPSEVEYLKVLQQYHISLHELKVEDILKTFMIDAAKWTTPERPSLNTPQECATAVQVAMETYTQDNKDMRTLARKAYQSFIRAYATYPANLKHIFHVKHLHLGHVAKSFCLQEAPTQISHVVSRNIGGAQKRPHDSYKESSFEKKKKKPRIDMISEFASGFDGVIKDSKAQKSKKIKKAFPKGNQRTKPGKQRTKLFKKKKH